MDSSFTDTTRLSQSSLKSSCHHTLVEKTYIRLSMIKLQPDETIVATANFFLFSPHNDQFRLMKKIVPDLVVKLNLKEINQFFRSKIM